MKFIKLFVAACLTTTALCCPPSPLTYGAEYMKEDKGTFLYLDKKEMTFKHENHYFQFLDNKHENALQLKNSNGELLLNFIPSENAGVGYSIRRIFMKNPDKTFIEIVADAGAHAKNCGYWLIGTQGGKWVTYVSIDNLTSMGYTPEEWHQLYSSVTPEACLVINSHHEYMPPGAKFGYERKYALDFSVELFWDESANWFGMRRR